MSVHRTPRRRRPRAPAWLAALALLASPAAGQPPQPAQPPAPAASPAPAPAVPAPDQHMSLKLLWSIMAAVDQANRTGNYSVLRDLGTAGFQANNNQAALGAIFAGLRGQPADLAETLMVTPAWDIAPRMVAPNVLRMRGSFPLRPNAIAFDLLFAWESGGWRLEGVSVGAMPAQP